MIVVCIYLILHTVPFWCDGLVRNWNRNLKINWCSIWAADPIHLQWKYKIALFVWKYDEILNDITNYVLILYTVQCTMHMCVSVSVHVHVYVNNNNCSANQLSETIFNSLKTFDCWQESPFIFNIQSIHWHSLTMARGFWTDCCFLG